MSDELMIELMMKVKTMLDVTSSEQIDYDKLMLMIEDGKQRLRSYAPDLTDADFNAPTTARELLMSYVRYANSNATEVWADNYSEEITRLRMAYKVRSHENQE